MCVPSFMKTLLRLAATASLAAAAVAACGNDPMEPGPVTPDPDAPLPPEDPAPARTTGHAELLGDWAAYPAWCSNTTGPERPITITLTRFEGYENSCAIEASRPIAEGHELDLVCQGEGQETRETIRASDTDDRLRLSYPDRDGATVAFTRCPSDQP
ncbi:MAG TPA: hypothetical protein DCX75_11770 [Brevundimonas sp.]|nr:hypothetical protein [Brevundimonas sp.]